MRMNDFSIALCAGLALLLLVAPAHGETRIRVLPRTTAPSGVTLTSATECVASVAANAASPKMMQPACDINIFAPSMPGDTFQVTFRLQLKYSEITYAPNLELVIRRAHFPESSFGSFDIRLPERVEIENLLEDLNRQLDEACGSSAASTQTYWQSALWAHALRVNIGIGRPVPGQFRDRLDRLIYLNCRALIEDDHTRATVAASISSNGLEVCRGNLWITLPADGVGNCRSTTGGQREPMLKALAASTRLQLLAAQVAA